MPYELSHDYWLYERYCRSACSQNEILVIGDSVVWGHYVPKDNTLSHYLNDKISSGQFANLGLDGIHPAAMEGLLRYYGKDISNKNIILHFNPLWMSTPKLDLQTEKEYNFNHPKLVAQFTPKIPCYKATFSERLSVLIRRHFALPNMISHINITYYNNSDIPSWTIENPYKNPFKELTFLIPETDEYENAAPPENNTTSDGYQWVRTETSLQWSCFRHTIKLLKEKQNRVFVLVGPFNENTLEGTSLKEYQKLKSQIEQSLMQNKIAYYIPPVLPATMYQDASHPLSGGYALIAEQLSENESFKSTILPAVE
jgi:hypothetical protein